MGVKHSHIARTGFLALSISLLYRGTGRMPPAVSGPDRQFWCPPASLAGSSRRDLDTAAPEIHIDTFSHG